MTYHLYMCVGGGQAGEGRGKGGSFIPCDEDGVWRRGADGEKRSYTRICLSLRERDAQSQCEPKNKKDQGK